MQYQDLKNILSIFWDSSPLLKSTRKGEKPIIFTVKYIVDTEQHSMNNQQQEIQNLVGQRNGYFLVQSILPFNHSNFILAHTFKLDFTQLEIELRMMIKNDEELFKEYHDSKMGYGIFSYERIAILFEETYLDSHKFLACFNGKGDDYKSIAELIIKKRGRLAGKIFGF